MLTALRCLAGLVGALAVSAAVAAPAGPPPASLAEFIKPLLVLPADSGGAWEGLDKDQAIRWTPGPTMTNKPSPDGNFFARIGQGTLGGRTLTVVATGARSMVFSVYIRDPAPPMDPDAQAASLRQAGFNVTPARCPIDARNTAARRWYRLALAKRKPAFLFAGAVPSGGAAYTLYLDELPSMTQAEAAAYTDNCTAAATAPAGVGPPAVRPSTGQAGVVALIEALLRPVGAPPSIPWASLNTLPVVAWKGAAPMKMTLPYSDVGADPNPRLLEGDIKTPTTRMMAIATGDDRGANHVLLRDGQHMPHGAVFDALARDGYTITPLRCGKAYTEMNQAWFRIAGPGKQPAVLYRAHHNMSGVLTEDYSLRLNNVLPPIEPGQTPATAGRCPGQ